MRLITKHQIALYFYLMIGAALATMNLSAVETGEKAPHFQLTDLEGEQHELKDYRGKYVVLEWTNHKCPFVRKYYSEGHMQALQNQFTDKGVVWLQIVSSAPGKQGHITAAEGKKLRSTRNIQSSAMLLDPKSEVGKKYDARTTPHMYLINPEGKLVYQGAIDSIPSTRVSDIEKATNYLKRAYEQVTSGETIRNASTKPYGCSVKY